MKSDAPAVGKKVDSNVEEVDADHGSVKRKLNITDLTMKSGLPVVGKKLDSNVEEVDADHGSVKKEKGMIEVYDITWYVL